MENEFCISADDIFCDDEAANAAKESFGIKYIYPWQRLVIANIIDSYSDARDDGNEDADGVDEEIGDEFCKGRQIVLLPTGAGKSLCFQVPALLLPGATLVIYPLLALMSDQERRMKSGSLECVVFKGGQTDEERAENFKRIKNGAKIIIANPEVLSSDNLLRQLKECNISHIAIDEAHCVSEWGDSFRPAYLELGRILKELACPVVTAFTATASPEVLTRISEVLFDGEAHLVRSDSDRPNIHYYVKETPAKMEAALFLSRVLARPMIIFCGTRNRTEDMAREICVAFGNEAARFYHAGLEKSEKTEIENWFFNSSDAVLCATCAYGMGVDKKDIHTVIHLDPPETAEAYIQEAGRGGRDGSVANAVLLWNYDDERKFKAFLPGSRKAVLRDFATTKVCRREVLLDALGAEKAVCSGCDICDRKNRFLHYASFGRFSRNDEKNVIADELPNAQEILLEIILKHNKFFTKDTLEAKFLEKANDTARKFIGVNIFQHEAFQEALDFLLFKNKVQILKFPYNGKIAVVKKRKKSTFLALRELGQVFRQTKHFQFSLRRFHFRLAFLRQFFQKRSEQFLRKLSFSFFSSAFLHNLRHKRKSS